MSKKMELIMSGNRAVNLIAALLFLILAAVALYRLLVFFPITIGGHEVGQTSSFFVFVMSAAMCLILFRGARASS
jgi:predicted membrane channel-forming protein YqfA (hemolysin III family)